MNRDLRAFVGREFDVLIVGSGIYGATAAWEAASRGLSVALIDRGDFGAATSANSLKTVHGGLRYLQHLDVVRTVESIRERRILLSIAAHLVHPLCCIMPTYGLFLKSKWVMRMGLIVNDTIGFDRNRGLDAEHRIPMGKVISKQDCLGAILGIDGSRVTGGVMWSDAQMVSSERLLLSFVQSAVKAGASAANYVEAVGFLRSNHRLCGIAAKDVLTGKEFEIRSKTVLNATGGYADKLAARAIPGIRRRMVRLSTAMNLVVRKSILPGCAAGVSSRFTHVRGNGKSFRGTRVLFFAPWNGFTLIGTHHRPFADDPDTMAVTEEEIETFLAEAGRAYPGTALGREDVAFFHKGFLPMEGVDPRTGEVRLTPHPRIHDHEREDGVGGLVTVVGVKYTTARAVAEKTVNLLFRKLKRDPRKSVSCRTPLAGGDIDRFSHFLDRVLASSPYALGPEPLSHLVRHYGSEYPAVLRLLERMPEWGKLVPGSDRVIAAEVVHAVRHEMAVTLSDVIRRRTDLGAGMHPGQECLVFCAALMARELGWDDGKVDHELRTAASAYRPVSAGGVGTGAA